MLLLTRRKQESIHIGENIIITVVDFTGRSVRLGISAPDDVKIIREELIERDKKRKIKNENRTVKDK